jgi:hypothetical protein
VTLDLMSRVQGNKETENQTGILSIKTQRKEERRDERLRET